MKRSWRRILVGSTVALTLAVAAGCATLAHKERELVFRVEPGEARWYSGLPDGVEELELAVPGQPLAKTPQSIHAWWWKSPVADAPTVLYLHGSRWNLTGQMFRIAGLRELGFSVLAIDYRGFGRSVGDLPSETTVYEDAQIAWQRLVQLEPEPSRRFIYGHSLGGAVAIDLAEHLAEHPSDQDRAAGLIVESTFTNLADVAAAVLDTSLPVRWLLSQKFDSIDKIDRVGIPVLVVHGTSDRYVPARFSQELFDRAKAPKRLLMVDGGTHNNSMRIGEDDYRAALRELFALAPS
ncbi:alpha/beta hydrolase [soil metagenome]